MEKLFTVTFRSEFEKVKKGCNTYFLIFYRLVEINEARGLHDLDNVWFQQDGASVHRVRAVLEDLRFFFGDRVVSLGTQREWAPRSPDLAVCDTFLWGEVKNRIYQSPIRDNQELLERITQEFQRIEEEGLWANAL